MTDLVVSLKLIAQGWKSNRANGVETHGALSFYIHNIFNVNGHSDYVDLFVTLTTSYSLDKVIFLGSREV